MNKEVLRCPVGGAEINSKTYNRCMREKVELATLRKEFAELRVLFNQKLSELGKATTREAKLIKDKEELSKENETLRSELNRLKTRGLIARIVNK